MAKHSYIIVGQDSSNVPQETVILYHQTTTATNGFNTADIITAYVTNDFTLDDQGGNASSIPSFSFSGTYSTFSCIEYRESGVSSGPSLSTLFSTANSIKNSTTDLNTQLTSGGLYATGMDQFSANVSINTGLGSADTVNANETYVETDSDPFYVVFSDFADVQYGTYWNASIGATDTTDNSFNVSLTSGDLFGTQTAVATGQHIRNKKRGLKSLIEATTTSANEHTFNKLIVILLDELISTELYKEVLRTSNIKNQLTSDEYTLLKAHLYI